VYDPAAEERHLPWHEEENEEKDETH
jgi:hypothetical protein